MIKSQCKQCNSNIATHGDFCGSCEMLMSVFYDGHQDYKIIMDDDLFQAQYKEWLKKVSFYDFYYIWFNYWINGILSEELVWNV